MGRIVNVRLLGRPAIEVEGRELPCPSKKALWLAAYLLMTRKPQSRAELAALYWDERDPKRALGSLRVALTKLPVELAACLHIERDHLGVNPAAVCTLDVDKLLAGGTDAGFDAQRDAVGAYAGDLFEGVDATEAPGFSDWLFAERHRLRQHAQGAHLALAEALKTQGEAAEARAVVERWLSRHPADEAAHRWLMQRAAEEGDAGRALAQFDVYRRALAVHDGSQPSAAMRELAEQLRAPASALPEAAWTLKASTQFFGRESELQSLGELLDEEGCRLITLHGMGGAGKTRLALALAESCGARFHDGVFVAALDTIAVPALFAQTVARACGLQPAGASSPLELMIAFFKRRNALLVLDNLEHLIAAEPSPDDIVAGAIAKLIAGTESRLKIVVTSREPIGLQEEWLFEVAGLTYPSAADAPSADERALSKLPAVRLFAQRARQLAHQFSLEANLAVVARICALLEGLPLGLELAAGWAGTLPIGELDEGLRNHAARFDSRQRNRVERHRSLDAVVGFSWDRLNEELRQALAGIAVLAGSFSTEAAGRIASASAGALEALAEKSLLVRSGESRWHAHEAVRQFAWSRSEETPARRTTLAARRDRYYLEWLAGIRPVLEGRDELSALADIERESANLREAWSSAVKGGDAALLAAAAPAWFDFLECRSYIAEGIAAAEGWLAAESARPAPNEAIAARYYLGLFLRFGARNADALRELESAEAALDERRSALRAKVLAAKAFTHLLLGKLAESEAAARAALESARAVAQPVLEASCCRVLGLAVLQAGRREEGRDWEREALSLAEKVGRPSVIAAAHNNLALAENHLGNYAAAESGYQSALDCWRGMQAVANVGRALHNLGVVARRRGDAATALPRYREALDYLRKAGDRNLIALNLMSTGDVLLRLGRAAEAREIAQQALALAEADGHMLPALDARIVLAQAAIQSHEHADAARQLVLVLDGAKERHYTNVLADAVVTVARLVCDAVPNDCSAAMAWAAEVAAMSDISASIRADAAAFCNTPLPATPTRTLDALVADAREALVNWQR